SAPDPEAESWFADSGNAGCAGSHARVACAPINAGSSPGVPHMTFSLVRARRLVKRWFSSDDRTGSPARRIRLSLEELETRLAPATFVWTGQGGNSNFSTAGNWANFATNAPGTPGTGDSLIFPLNGPSAPGTVTDDLAGTTNFNSITFLST